MPGMDRQTGRSLDGWPHIAQSLGVIFTTRIGSRVMRRAYGSDCPDLQDAPTNVESLLDSMVAVATAIDLYEPRVDLEGFRLEAADESGAARINVSVREVATGIAQEVPL